MNRESRYIFAIALMLFAGCFTACEKADEVPGSKDPVGPITLMVRSDSLTKVSLQENMSVFWDKGDSISLVYQSGATKLVAAESGPYVAFQGTVPSEEYLSGAFALYPYDPAAAISVGSVATHFVHSQRQKADFPMMGTVEKKNNEYRVSMKNFGGLLEMDLERDDITLVSVSGNNGEWLSGPAAATMSGGVPVILRKDKNPGSGSVTLRPDSLCFAPGRYYVSIPATNFTAGISVTLFTVAGKTATKKGTEPLLLQRSHTTPLGVVDSGLVWEDVKDDTLLVRFYGSWPFTEELPAKSYTTSPAFADEVHDFYTADSCRFTIYSKKGLAYLSSAESFKIQGSENDYITFPAFEGKYLSGVRMRTGHDGNMRIPSIRTADGKSLQDGGWPLAYPFQAAGADYTWHLFDTKAGERYRLNFECSGYYDNYASGVTDYSACIQEIELIYSATPKSNPSPRIWKDVIDAVPDFSRVGYQYGDKEIPSYPVGIRLKAPGDGSDCTQMIQNAIDNVYTGMAVLLEEGTFCVEGKIVIRRNNVVLRGCGDKTVLKATGARAEGVNDCLIRIGTGSPVSADWTTATAIVENAGCGQMYVRVEHPEFFRRGDRVQVGRMPFQKWIHDLKMDNILDTLAGRIPYQEMSWKPQNFNQKWERTVVAVEGDRLYFENPLVMSLTSDYCSSYVVKVSSLRNAEVGIESIKLDSEYDASVKTSTSKWVVPGDPKWYYSDENHAWYAIEIGYAEHCWVKDVKGEHFAMGVVDMNSGAKNITVTGCESLNPVSLLTGSRRYAFYIRKGQLCLVRNCLAERDRHAFVNGATTCGPNVYSRCSATAMCAEIGPHQYWATGTLFDKITSDNDICLHDRAGRGGSAKTPGQGWAAAGCVLWNCTIQVSPYPGVSGSIVCQSPWVSAKNWAFGCGPSTSIVSAVIPYFDGLARPEGEWASKGSAMPEESLYEKQRSARTNPALDFPNMAEGYNMDEYYKWNQ